MPVSQIQSPGDWTDLPIDPTTGKPSPENYAKWERDEDAYIKAKDSTVSRAYDQSPLTIHPGNYQVATDADYMDLARKYDEAQQRQSVQIDNSAATQAQMLGYQDRGRENEAARMYADAAHGRAPSVADAQTNAALNQQAQMNARQAGLYGGARAIQASSPAYGQAVAQGAYGRMGEVQQGYAGAGSMYGSMRAGDLATQQQAMGAAYSQGQLDSSQQARNDVLARTYLGAKDDLSIEQLGADQQYEAQKSIDQFGAMSLAQRRSQGQQVQNAQEIGAGVAGVSALATGGASMAATKKPDQ